MDGENSSVESPAPAPAPAEAPSPAPAPAPAPAEAPAPSPSPAPAEPKSALEAAVLGLEATGLKLDQPLPADQVVRIGAAKDGDPGAEGKTQAATGDPFSPGTAGGAAPPAPGEPPKKTDQEEVPGPDDADLPNPTEAELAAAPAGLRRRFRQVINQNARLKEQFASVQPAAQQFEKLQSFMSSHELDARSAANALRIAALAQGAFNGRVDPSTAAAELQHWADQLRGLAGDVLPADVQKRLDDGEISEAAAKEIAQLRASRVTQARRAELDTVQVNERQAAQSRDQIVSAIQTWETSMRARDPDYAVKAESIEAKVLALRALKYGGQMPPNVKDALALVQEAYDFATRQVKALRPAPTEVRSPLNGATPPKSTMRAEPKTALEAAIQGLERMGM